VKLTTYPGGTVYENAPPAGWMSGCCTNQVDGWSDHRFVAHTWTVPLASRPVRRTLKVWERTCWWGKWLVFSTTRLQSRRLGDS